MTNAESVRKWHRAHPNYQREWRKANPGYNAMMMRKYRANPDYRKKERFQQNVYRQLRRLRVKP